MRVENVRTAAIGMLALLVTACGHSSTGNNAALESAVRDALANSNSPPEWARPETEWRRIRVGYTPVAAAFPEAAQLSTQPIGTEGHQATLATIGAGEWGMAVFVAEWPSFERRAVVQNNCRAEILRAAQNFGGAQEVFEETPIEVGGLEGCHIHYKTAAGVESYSQILVGRGFFSIAMVFAPLTSHLATDIAHRFFPTVQFDEVERMPRPRSADAAALAAEHWPYYFADVNGMAARLPGNPTPIESRMRIAGTDSDFDVDAYVLFAESSSGAEQYTLAAGTRPAGVEENHVTGHVSDVVRSLEGCALRESWEQFPQAYRAHNSIYDCDDRSKVLYVRQLHVGQWVYETTALVSHAAEQERRGHLLEQLDSLRVFF